MITRMVERIWHEDVDRLEFSNLLEGDLRAVNYLRKADSAAVVVTVSRIRRVTISLVKLPSDFFFVFFF